MKRLLTCLLLIAVSFPAICDEIIFENSWGKQGISVEDQTASHLIVNFSIRSFALNNIDINGQTMQEVVLPGVFLPNDEGAPNLPGLGRYIALPEGAQANLNILEYRMETYTDIDVAPAPRIPWDTERGPLSYKKDESIYQRSTLYPEAPFRLSEKSEIRGVDVAMLGITPFQYNPSTRELIVYKDIKIEITFSGGNGQFGEERLRSRWWDPILMDAILNSASLPEVDYGRMYKGAKDTGCEYLIITPNGSEFVAWADSIKIWREKQGILTDVVTLADVGGNNYTAIENYLNNAYNTWTIPPAAVLFLGDYGTNASNSIISPLWNSYCVSDNIYADVNGDHMPDMVAARMTAQNAAHLETMITKFLNYERTPPVNPHYYNHPVTAMGWQTERWFQLCSEIINGFWEYGLGKQPKRENKIYEGTPGTVWSTAPNTNQVVAYFGPSYMGYVPSTPEHLNDWNGDADRINDAINAGAFMLQHRDHGYEQGWGEPDYSTSDLTGLNNDDLIYVLSVNCLTGKYNLSGECFTEAFHRHQKGALGLIAASEVSYSFVNDAYVWGLYDNLWPDFMPDYGTTPPSRDILPAFGNAAGKYFLKQSAWPYNTANKEVTYHLFHHHGDAFSTVYTEIPQNLTVLHNSKLLNNATSFAVLANEGALIGLYANGEVIGAAEGTGAYVDIAIAAQSMGTQVFVTVTKQNHYRYSATLDVIDSNVPYVVQESFLLNDNAGNGNGLLDFGESVKLDLTMENIGQLQATNVNVTLSTSDENITFTDDAENFGNIQAGATVTKTDAFAFDVAGTIPDGQAIVFDVEATGGSYTWISQFLIMAHAPAFELSAFAVEDPAGNNNGRLDPGETADMVVTLANNGSTGAQAVVGALSCNSSYITVNETTQTFGNIAPGSETEKSYSVSVEPDAPQGQTIVFTIDISGTGGCGGTLEFTTFIGKFPALVLDLDPKFYSGPVIYSTFQDMDIYADYLNVFPEDLGIYKNIFVCLGVKFNNHELTEDEGQKLKDFLSEGGNLYMEGRVTWFDDPQTPVHPLFNIETESLAYYQITGASGIDGTFTGGMEFGYDGEYAVCNYAIHPVDPAYTIFVTEGSERSSAVAFDAGDYKTIGSTLEFGQLVDGNPPSTKLELMTRILNFLNGTITSTEEQLTSESADFYGYPNPFSHSTSLRFTLEQETDVSIEIYDQQGNLVSSPVSDKTYPAGSHEVIWNATHEARSLPSGIYYCRYITGNSATSYKLLKIN
ncbi:MAG: T9SS type A sorting domain-containing protein [Bacteroidales bacterium]|nr:T9SS type A sorting domain-containing protein [Bacteroidales bacterium]